MEPIIRVILPGLFAVVAGCHSATAPPPKEMQLQVQASQRTAVVGDTVIFLSRTKSTLGTDAKIQWVCPGGLLRTENEGKTARVTYTEPGSYTVDGVLVAGGKEVDRTHNLVDVTPLPPKPAGK